MGPSATLVGMTSSEVPDPPAPDPDRAPLLRSTVLALGASTLLFGVGALLFAIWVWVVVRAQQRMSPFVGAYRGDGSHVTLVDRIDIFTNTFVPLAWASIVTGLSLGLRLFADFMAAGLGRLAPEPAVGPDTP
jgi:hypothetical protein